MAWIYHGDNNLQRFCLEKEPHSSGFFVSSGVLMAQTLGAIEVSCTLCISSLKWAEIPCLSDPLRGYPDPTKASGIGNRRPKRRYKCLKRGPIEA